MSENENFQNQDFYAGASSEEGQEGTGSVVKRRRGRPPLNKNRIQEDSSEAPRMLDSEGPAPDNANMDTEERHNDFSSQDADENDSWQRRRFSRFGNRRQRMMDANHGGNSAASGNEEGAQNSEDGGSNGNGFRRGFRSFRQRGFQMNRDNNQSSDSSQNTETTEQNPVRERYQMRRQRSMGRSQESRDNSRTDRRNQRQHSRDGRVGAVNEHRNPKVGDAREVDRVTEMELARMDEQQVAHPNLVNLNDLLEMSLDNVNKSAISMGLQGTDSRPRNEVLLDIVRFYAENLSNAVIVKGVVEVTKNGFGFIRLLKNSYTTSIEDPYISPTMVRRMLIRTGDTVVGRVRQPKEGEQFYTVAKIITINGDEPDAKKHITSFENLTPYFPTKRFILEREPSDLSSRVIDLVTPIGRGQRGLIVAGPRTGKTVIMQKIANSIIANDPDVELIILLIDERPEEVTDMKREVKAEVVSSTFDQPPERHVQVAEMVIEKAKRQVEHGHHVVIMLDSITRLARAYNTIQPHSGRILSGGVDANALHKPKRFFGAARNIEGGGSLTILATALVDTGSKMDEVIFEEFKGTGNMELHLDHKLVDRRIYPAIDFESSGTRREELLVHPDELERIWCLRRAYCSLGSTEAMEDLLKRLKKTGSNIEFLLTLRMPEKGQDD